MILTPARKHKLIIVGSVVGLFAVIYLISHYLLQRTLLRNATTPVPNPSAMIQTYNWDGKTLSYPATFVLRETKATDDKLNLGIKKGDVTGFTLSLRDLENKDDFISVGAEGKTCAEIKANLCIGSHPTWTNSRSGEVLAMYDTVVKTFEH